jgi:MoaA/NifB/PqqE/SkfB family radical SAM enzyme
LKIATRKERLSIEVTTHCNSRCLHCFVRAAVSKRTSLQVDLVKEIIAEGYDSAYRHLHITGGEPLLWEGLFECLDYAFGIGYETVLINTNGTLLAEGINSRFTGYDGLKFSVTLQGPEGLHDQVRGKGSYLKTKAGIKKLLDAGFDTFIFTVASRSLLSDLLRFAQNTYKDFPAIKSLTFIQLIRVKCDIFGLSKELLEPNDFIQLIRMISFLNIYGLKIDVLNNPLACVAAKLLELPWTPRSPPLQRAGRIVVLANGDICLSHSSRTPLGKYEPGMIEKILSSREYRKANESDKATCPRCEYFEQCTENGMVRPSEWFRDMNPEVPYCKRVLDKATPWPP